VTPHNSALMPSRIQITGASGSGTTTLGALIAERHGHRHLDTDDFYWLPIEPQYTQKRLPEERLALLRAELGPAESWVLSGSLVDWGDPLMDEFELVVFLLVPTELRLARLKAREAERYGEDAVAPGGSRHEAMEAFLEWASHYDAGGLEGRSRALHEEWIDDLTCKVVRLEGDRTPEQNLARLEDEYAKAV
jgi:adenylate kinase family enzyme